MRYAPAAGGSQSMTLCARAKNRIQKDSRFRMPNQISVPEKSKPNRSSWGSPRMVMRLIANATPSSFSPRSQLEWDSRQEMPQRSMKMLAKMGWTGRKNS